MFHWPRVAFWNGTEEEGSDQKSIIVDTPPDKCESMSLPEFTTVQPAQPNLTEMSLRGGGETAGICYAVGLPALGAVNAVGAVVAARVAVSIGFINAL
ncbi:hypothetical protein N8T08_000948 [Aspergillus melleus]|uniref:Uncharacterized protein n=1 Tax=Aspergillus melleus TaxID=138277 RepID=A0ACC3BAM1_9EURO|nr:hypothetical protein N8T08_000948 [Aspergillus melleus]